jgi:bifunctional DNA-binding transcriptional regulator/antitoxin component of YhaV-PrlF toxin-antitoxin module
MSDIYRLKIVSKRQVTIPQMLLNSLQLREGDELEIEVEGTRVLSLRPLKLVPVDFFSQDALTKLEQRVIDADRSTGFVATALNTADVQAKKDEIHTLRIGASAGESRAHAATTGSRRS